MNYNDYDFEKFIEDLLKKAGCPMVTVAKAAELIGVSQSSIRRAYNFEGLKISRAGNAKRSKILIPVRNLGTWLWKGMSNQQV